MLLLFFHPEAISLNATLFCHANCGLFEVIFPNLFDKILIFIAWLFVFFKKREKELGGIRNRIRQILQINASVVNKGFNELELLGR